MELAQLTSWTAQEYGKFSSLMGDYLKQKENVHSFYSEFPSEAGLIHQAKKKLTNFQHRTKTLTVLKRQLNHLNLSPKQIENLEKFGFENTVTITTGHQLNLFTGPLYFFHKIIQVIKASDEMSEKYPDFNFIPVFWMATEDHDFEEINHFYFKGKKFTWERTAKGAVGRLNLDGIDTVFNEFFKELPDSTNAKKIKHLIESSYLNSTNLTEATQKLVQELFGKYGLLMIDGDDKDLKELMIPAFEEDLIQHTAFKTVGKTNVEFEKLHYPTQVHPREINLFYLGNGSIRERIIKENNLYYVLNTNFQFTEEEILKELHTHPERFSPNVILRPLFQETILPNIAYVGGTGESAYWLQLKDFFESQNVLYPIIIVRNSMLLLTQKQFTRLEKLGIDFKDLLLPYHQLLNQNIENHSSVEIPFDAYLGQLNQMFDELMVNATQTDLSFSKMVEAQRKMQTKGLEKMKTRLLLAEKRRQSDRVNRIQLIYDELFPQGILQERVSNFSEFYLEFGDKLISEFYKDIQAIDFYFTIKTMA